MLMSNVLSCIQDEYHEWKEQRDAEIEAAGGIEVVMAQQKFKQRKFEERMRRWEKYGK